MTEPSNDKRVAEAGYLGISAMSDDTLDTDDLYEALINPHGGGGKPGSMPPGGGMMMPPMGMMGGGAGGQAAAGGGGGGFSLPAATAGVRAPAGMTGAGGAGLGATPEPPSVGSGGGGGVPVGGGGGFDLGALGGGGGPAGVELGAGAADLGDLGGFGGGPVTGGGPGGLPGMPSKGGTDSLRAAVEPTAHAGEAITNEAQGWQEIANLWPQVKSELDSLTGQGRDLFGLVHEAEHGFNEAQQWLTSRAKEASEASNAMGDVLVAARKAWEETEQANVDQANQITREVQR